ncbi:MAG TPA: hypothetical protein VMM78_03010 [Thermomicrobiales bacterium]|nr:hypothetical protein [Thermomicrobiales bacterium]
MDRIDASDAGGSLRIALSRDTMAASLAAMVGSCAVGGWRKIDLDIPH